MRLKKVKEITDGKLQNLLLNIPDKLIANALVRTPDAIRDKILKNLSKRRREQTQQTLSEQSDLSDRSVRSARVSLYRQLFGEPAEEEEESDPETPASSEDLTQQKGEDGVSFQEALERLNEILTGPADPEVKRNTILTLCDAFPSEDQSAERIETWTRDRLEEASEQFIIDRPEEYDRFHQLMEKLEENNEFFDQVDQHLRADGARALLRNLLEEKEDSQDE